MYMCAHAYVNAYVCVYIMYIYVYTCSQQCTSKIFFWFWGFLFVSRYTQGQKIALSLQHSWTISFSTTVST